MKGLNIIYWIVTGLFAVMMAFSGFFNASRNEQAVEVLAGLGYPEYFSLIIGSAKILGVIGILIQRFPKVTEWAYAGFVFLLTGAFISHLLGGDPFSKAIAPLIPLTLGVISYYLYNRRKGAMEN